PLARGLPPARGTGDLPNARRHTRDPRAPGGSVDLRPRAAAGRGPAAAPGATGAVIGTRARHAGRAGATRSASWLIPIDSAVFATFARHASSTLSGIHTSKRIR